MVRGFVRGVLGRWLAWGWPWVVLAVVAGVAVWHAVDFPDEVDEEFPRVVRPTFSRRPPAAYRLAEPGDTIDRVALYASAAGVVLAAWGLVRDRTTGLWVSALGLTLAALWHAATPGPTFDGWHGLGWRALADPSAPAALRWALAIGGMGLVGLVAGPVVATRGSGLWRRGREAGVLGLLAAAAVLVALRQMEIPGVEPVGYWPRWAFVLGMTAFDLALVRLMQMPGGAGSEWLRPGGAGVCSLGREPQDASDHQFPPEPQRGDAPAAGPERRIPNIAPPGHEGLGRDSWGLRPRLHDTAPPGRRGAWTVLGALVAWAVLVAGGLALIWLHRPLDRFRAIVPGRIFISGMPTRRGLEVAHRRHRFKTIVNLFPEDLPGLRSPLLDDEVRFAHAHGITYVGSPAGAAQADAFLDRTLALAQDPAAWPILVHCHACMDRTPAWWGIYQFVVEGRPLREILQEIERHRGCRPKASVTLLYNRVLPSRAPARYAGDPTARLLRRCAEGTEDPFFAQVRAEAGRANRTAIPRVSRREDAGEAGRRP
jgi:protein tyrosine phosphatase (PTP) superfamily phosphohydrolase (DUF442 family)